MSQGANPGPRDDPAPPFITRHSPVPEMTESVVPGSLEKSRCVPSENDTRTLIGEDVGMEMGLCMDDDADTD